MKKETFTAFQSAMSHGFRKTESHQCKGDFDRIAAMLSRLGSRDYSVNGRFGEYGYTEFDPDSDPDSDFDKI